MEVIMYSTHCPQCKVLAKKLEQKNIPFTEVDDIELMRSLGIMSAPMLSIDGGAPINFKDSINWVKTVEV